MTYDTLSESVLFFSDNFVLDEEKCKKWRNHIVEGTSLRDDVEVGDESVRHNRVLSCLDLDFGWVHSGSSPKVQDGIVDQQFQS